MEMTLPGRVLSGRDICGAHLAHDVRILGARRGLAQTLDEAVVLGRELGVLGGHVRRCTRRSRLPSPGFGFLTLGYRGATMSPRTAWLTIDEVAERLGLSLADVYEDIATGRLPAQRYGESYLVRRSDVDAFSAPGAIAG